MRYFGVTQNRSFAHRIKMTCSTHGIKIEFYRNLGSHYLLKQAPKQMMRSLFNGNGNAFGFALNPGTALAVADFKAKLINAQDVMVAHTR
ncbi:hypothetical protein OH492_28110 [Vibrio chagasii]|nr:hypothetical protein [Vibrio chagasii]